MAKELARGHAGCQLISQAAHERLESDATLGKVVLTVI
jgi:hypothetical protein